MLSVDGPSVNWSVLENLNTHRRTKEMAEFFKTVLLNFFLTFMVC